MAAPPLTPGCLFAWQDDVGTFRIALAIAVEPHLKDKFYVVTYVRDLRIKTITLATGDEGNKWRALHGE